MGKIMKSFRTKKWLKGLMLAMLLIVGSTVFSASAKEVQAATAGFKTIDGKTYYIKSDGSKQKGWMTLGGYKYYFNTKTGVQVKGWMKVNGKYTYYFTKGKGVMATGWMTDSKGHKRYFNPKTGKLTTGWVNCSKGRKRYFTKGGGIMATGWLTNSKGQKRYFYQNFRLYGNQMGKKQIQKYQLLFCHQYRLYVYWSEDDQSEELLF